MLYRVHLAWAGFELTMLMVMSTHCIGSCKSNYHTITTTKTSHYSVDNNEIRKERNYESDILKTQTHQAILLFSQKPR